MNILHGLRRIEGISNNDTACYIIVLKIPFFLMYSWKLEMFERHMNAWFSNNQEKSRKNFKAEVFSIYFSNSILVLIENWAWAIIKLITNYFYLPYNICYLQFQEISALTRIQTYSLTQKVGGGEGRNCCRQKWHQRE